MSEKKDDRAPRGREGRWSRPSAAEMRRTAARIRSGVVGFDDPEVPRSEAADVLEELAQVELLKSVKIETLEFERACRELDEQQRAARERNLVAELHRLKQLPEARVPGSRVAEALRQLNRLRRNELGRPRKRKRKA